RRWGGSAPRTKLPTWPFTWRATKARSPPASTSSSMAASCSDVQESNADQRLMNKIDLNGRAAVVTGGAQGFGRAIAERFVASGAKVAIWDHDIALAEKTAKEVGSEARAFQVDVTDTGAVEKARDATIAAFGTIDILVNNAGIAGINKTVWET